MLPPAINKHNKTQTHQSLRRGINAEDSDGVTGTSTRTRTLVAVAHWHQRQQATTPIHDPGLLYSAISSLIIQSIEWD